MVSSQSKNPVAEAMENRIEEAANDVDNKISDIFKKIEQIAKSVEEKYGNTEAGRQQLDQEFITIKEELKEALDEYYTKLDEIEQDLNDYIEENKDKVPVETLALLKNIVSSSIDVAKLAPLNNAMAAQIQETMERLERAKEALEQKQETPESIAEEKFAGNTPYLGHFNAHSSNPEINLCISEGFKGPDQQPNPTTTIPVIEGPGQTIQNTFTA